MGDLPCDHDALADTQNCNVEILRKIKSNDPGFQELDLFRSCDEDQDYVPTGEGLGRLGYFVGNNVILKKLSIWDLREGADEDERYGCDSRLDSVEAFFKGLSRNKSIETLELHCELLGGDIFRMIGPFLNNNHNLTKLRLGEYELSEFGREEARHLSLALGRCSKSLRVFDASCIELGDAICADIAVGLSVHPQLTVIHLNGNRIGRTNCIALGTLLRWTTTELEVLSLQGNSIDDEGVKVLTSTLTNNTRLTTLDLSYNPWVSNVGWRSLSTLLSTTNLKNLQLNSNFIDDETAFLFAGALLQNDTLESLVLTGHRNTMTTAGWSAFSQLLCDTSSINSTFLSNHTIRYFGYTIPTNVSRYFALNASGSEAKQIAMCKILRSHCEIDVKPLFEWDLNALPLAVRWFNRARTCPIEMRGSKSVRKRKFWAIYQFVRDMPILVVSKWTEMDS